jgi:hypothetical protein
MPGFQRPERKRLTRLCLTPGTIRGYEAYAQKHITRLLGKTPLDPDDPGRITITLAYLVQELAQDLVSAREDRERMDLALAKSENVLHDLYYALYPPEEP